MYDCYNGFLIYYCCNVTAGSSQRVGAAKDSKSGNEIETPETYASTRTPSGPVSGGQDMYQGSTAHIGG